MKPALSRARSPSGSATLRGSALAPKHQSTNPAIHHSNPQNPQYLKAHQATNCVVQPPPFHHSLIPVFHASINPPIHQSTNPSSQPPRLPPPTFLMCAMIQRYSRPQMREIWSEQRKLEIWLQIELLASEALSQQGLVPKKDLRQIQSRAAFSIE